MKRFLVILTVILTFSILLMSCVTSSGCPAYGRVASNQMTESAADDVVMK